MEELKNQFDEDDNDVDHEVVDGIILHHHDDLLPDIWHQCMKLICRIGSVLPVNLEATPSK